MSKKARDLLEKVGLSNRRNHHLYQLSGGEQQRVAIAIALANEPGLLLADEPTGSIDKRNGSMVYDLFKELNESLGLTVVIVTHDRNLSRRVGRVVAIRDGRTSSEFRLMHHYVQELASLRSLGMLDKVDPAGTDASHEELVVLDRTGRLQLPREYLDALGFKGRGMMRAEFENGKIVLEPKDIP